MACSKLGINDSLFNVLACTKFAETFCIANYFFCVRSIIVSCIYKLSCRAKMTIIIIYNNNNYYYYYY